MSTFPNSEIGVLVLPGKLSSVRYPVLATTLAALGLAAIWPALFSLWTIWTTDALKSIGMAIPLVSLVLILRVWRGLGWRADGTWWGLVLLLSSVAAAWVEGQAVLILVVSPHWSTPLPPPSLVLLAYGAGAVLLFGGVRLFRAALFPTLLLWFANPIPHVFSSLVDLPLQHVSAHIARAFAMSLGHSLTPDSLHLMFTPDFGMFIAPGCNGIRGSMTMGFIALIAGYVYQFRWYANALVVLGAILLGYVFNLARLCLLVLYYAVALHFPSLQNKAESADYLIGAALFLVATLLLFTVIHRLRGGGNGQDPRAAVVSDYGRMQRRGSPSRPVQIVAMGIVMLFGWVGLARAIGASHSSAIASTVSAEARFPQQIGGYRLLRTWNESLLVGTVIYVWGQYAPAGGGTPIAIGISPVPDWHDPSLCHSVRAETPIWQGQLTVETAENSPANLNSAFYSDGVTQYLEASTMCHGGECNEFTTERSHFGLVYSRPDPKSLVGKDANRSIRILLRAETIDMSVSGDAARQHLTEDIRAFLASVNFSDLTSPYN
jgi:exosortase J